MQPTVFGPYLWADERYYEEEIKVIRACLSPGAPLVDVGANVGVLTIAGALQVQSKGRVIAVEAHPVTYFLSLRESGGKCYGLGPNVQLRHW